MRFTGSGVALLGIVALAGCSNGNNANKNTNTGDDGGVTNPNEVLIEVSGQVIYDPVELQWRGLPADWVSTGTCSNGQPSSTTAEVCLPGYTTIGTGSACGPADGGVEETDAGAATDAGVSSVDAGSAPLGPPPCLSGDTFRVEDAIRALNDLPPLNNVPLTSTGVFDVMKVNVTNTTLALVGTLLDPSIANNTEALPTYLTGYGLGKAPPEGSPWPVTTSLPLYVASPAFVQKLAAAIGQDYAHVLAAGVVIGHVTDVTGTKGVAGVQLELVAAGPMFDEQEDTPGPFYLSEDLSSAVDATADPSNAVTTSNGLFVRLNAGNAANYTVANPATPGVGFEQHLNGSRAGTVLEVFFHQCTTPSTGQEGCH